MKQLLSSAKCSLGKLLYQFGTPLLSFLYLYWFFSQTLYSPAVSLPSMEPTTVDPAKQILSDTQFEILQKLRKSGTKHFSRNDYKVLQGVRRRCRNTLKHFEAAKLVYIEIDELMRG